MQDERNGSRGEVRPPRIVKAQRVVGATLAFRDATVDDAAFILGLRLDPRKAKHLSPTDASLEAQIEWLRRYRTSADQAYFIVESLQGEAVGTVRLYDARDDSFCWGSWIRTDDAPKQFAVESALMVYRYALNHLGFRCAHFDVRCDNVRVWQFHERFGARRVGATEQDYFYVFDHEAIRAALDKYARYLPAPLRVISAQES